MRMYIVHGAKKLGLDGMYLTLKSIPITVGHLLTSQAFLFR
jgi:hypothetical protein